VRHDERLRASPRCLASDARAGALELVVDDRIERGGIAGVEGASDGGEADFGMRGSHLGPNREQFMSRPEGRFAADRREVMMRQLGKMIVGQMKATLTDPKSSLAGKITSQELDVDVRRQCMLNVTVE
jgi:hypothetical protein